MGNEHIQPATEEEEKAIHDEYNRAKTAGSRGKRLHPLENGEPLCNHLENHNPSRWSNSKPMSVFPLGYKELCRYCVKVWREEDV